MGWAPSARVHRAEPRRRRRLALWMVLCLTVIAVLVWREARPAADRVHPVAAEPDSTAPRVVARPPETHRTSPVRAPLFARVGEDAGPSATLNAKTVHSLFDVTQLLDRNATEAAAEIERYCAETATLPKHLFGDRPDGGSPRDAAYFLEPLVTWETHPRSEGMLQIPQALGDKIQAAKDDWATVLLPTDAAGLDFGWMTQLLDYDYWSLATVGPMADQAANVDPFWSPIPNYQSFLQYAKLRYVRALAQGDVDEAVNEVQHVADLLHSNGIVIAEIHAAKLLRLGQQFQLAAVQKGYSTTVSRTLDAAGYDQFHDLTLAGTAFMMPGVEGAVLRRALGCVPDACVAMSEAVAQRREMERVSGQEDDSFWSLAGNLGCDSALVNLLKRSPSSDVDALEAFHMGDPLPLEKYFAHK